MAGLANRTQAGAPAGRSLMGDVLGFDPLRGIFGYANNAVGGFEIQRTQGGYEVELPVAGFRPEQVNVTLDQGVLTISGESERRKFTRTLAVPDEIDPESVEARVEHGMLTLSLRLHPKAQPKKIEIRGTSPATTSAN